MVRPVWFFYARLTRNFFHPCRIRAAFQYRFAKQGKEVCAVPAGFRRTNLRRRNRRPGMIKYGNTKEIENGQAHSDCAGERGKRYVRRNKAGQFKQEVSVGRSLSADRRRKAKTKVPKGQGDRGETE